MKFSNTYIMQFCGSSVWIPPRGIQEVRNWCAKSGTIIRSNKTGVEGCFDREALPLHTNPRCLCKGSHSADWLRTSLRTVLGSLRPVVLLALGPRLSSRCLAPLYWFKKKGEETPWRTNITPTLFFDQKITHTLLFLSCVSKQVYAINFRLSMNRHERNYDITI